MTPLGAVAAAFLLLCGGGGMASSVALKRKEEKALAARVDRAVGPRAPGAEGLAAHSARQAAKVFLSRLRRLFTYRIGRDWGASAKTPTLLLLALASAGVSTAAGFFLFRLPAAILAPAGLAAFVLAPRVLIRSQQRRAEARFGELFPDTVDMIVRMIRAGLPVASAIAAVGEEAPAPVGAAFRSIAEETRLGIPLEKALSACGERVGVADFRFFLVAVGLQGATGGNLAATLEMLSEIIRKRRAIRLKAKAATAEVRISALVLGGIPFFILAALSFLSPSYLRPLIHDPRGNLLAGSALLSLLAGGVTMRSMIRRSMME